MSQFKLKVLGWKNCGCETKLDLWQLFVLILQDWSNFAIEKEKRKDKGPGNREAVFFWRIRLSFFLQLKIILLVSLERLRRKTCLQV